MLQLVSRAHVSDGETRARRHCSLDRLSDPGHPRERLGSDQQRASALLNHSNMSRLIRRARTVSTRRCCNSVPLPRALSDHSELACSATSTAFTILTIPESDRAPISSLGLHWSRMQHGFTGNSLEDVRARVDVATQCRCPGRCRTFYSLPAVPLALPPPS